ncbi:pseudaminic acid CMP-transferase [Alcanivorax xiamenensis]|uniref:Pseudaminic acid CMP-transferase n=1 Tax=Alcanivorax xiamenensis TaxID=1177156 RepID=A0ABQ6Y5Y7_9GAMM|nr:pseudaminic acid cytidylyltransferase [Alcanivorax xiamenensis]KAF0804706.1 pseudaminic acid CMP-transferase [Alcanivorax xiamenensis]
MTTAPVRVAVIPARGGSKRIPHKNIKPFCGRPMIAWSIQAAREADCFDRILVSTDDDAVAAVALAEGAEVPFRRPAELADDHTPTVPVIAHAVAWLRQQGVSVSEVCCLYATAPFVRAGDILAALEALRAGGGDYAFPVTTFAFPIQRALRLDPRQRVSMFEPAHANTRSQDLEEAFHDAGQFYWGRARAWLDGRAVFTPGSVAVRLPRHRVQDIDTPEDWRRAEALFQVLQSEPDPS